MGVNNRITGSALDDNRRRGSHGDSNQDREWTEGDRNTNQLHKAVFFMTAGLVAIKAALAHSKLAPDKHKTVHI